MHSTRFWKIIPATNSIGSIYDTTENSNQLQTYNFLLCYYCGFSDRTLIYFANEVSADSQSLVISELLLWLVSSPTPKWIHFKICR